MLTVSLVYLCIAHVVQPPTAQAAQYSVPTIQYGTNDEVQTAVPVFVIEANKSAGYWRLNPKP